MVRLDKEVKKLVLDFILRNVTQMVNAIFATVQPPKDALIFLYERMYFAYASEKNTVVNNVAKLEEISKKIMHSDYKSKMLLKITRPIVKLNFLMHAESKIFEKIKFPENFNIEDSDNIQLVVNYADSLLSNLIQEIFKCKNESSLFQKDEIIEKVTKAIDNMINQA